VRARIVGRFFNDGSGTNRGGDRTGDIIAGVQKQLDATGSKQVTAFRGR
jgi:hypothetical protein